VVLIVIVGQDRREAFDMEPELPFEAIVSFSGIVEVLARKHFVDLKRSITKCRSVRFHNFEIAWSTL
jgi:hypothetical protein